METNFTKLVLNKGGIIKPLLVHDNETNGTGLCNPSVAFYKDRMIVNIRHVGYNLYHSEHGQKFPSWHGPLIYLHPEDDLTLRTENYIGELNPETLEETRGFIKANMFLNKKPVWTFIGLEDGRLINWGNKLGLCGVRRDTKQDGEGRMEISFFEYKNLMEQTRIRIEPPKPTYCEKNWMPIEDMPYHFVKWTNPTEVVSVEFNKDGKTAQAHTVSTTVNNNISFPRDIRGGSQVIRYKGGYIALTHEVELWFHENDTKDAQYYHRFIVWDENFNVIDASEAFKFMDARVEFCAGMARKDNDFYITFGFQDNAAFILKTTEDVISNFIAQ
jgi:predicted GH43/DUF377 family glycosyl hydrolase